MKESTVKSRSHEDRPEETVSSGWMLVSEEADPIDIPVCGLLVGRSNICDLVLADDSDASRRHALLMVMGGIVWVVDQGATNGTLVDGELVERGRVGEGAVVVLGSGRFELARGEGVMPEGLGEQWHRWVQLSASKPRSDLAAEALRELAAAESCQFLSGGALRLTWPDDRTGLSELGPWRRKLVECALGES